MNCLYSTYIWRSFLPLVLIGTLGHLGGCGSGGGSGNVDGGIGGTGISAGAISGFSSIVVNDVRYETAGATITVDDQPGTESDLKVGMVVTVQFTISGPTRRATSVEAEDVVEGPVEFVAADGLSLVVLKQTVLVDNATVIDTSIPGQDIKNLKPGVDHVEVSGFVKTSGVIAATFLERKAAPGDLELKGFVSEHNPAAQTFKIGSLTINYDADDISEMPNPAGPQGWNGLLVEVKGSAFSDSLLTATKVEPEQLPLVDGQLAEIEGFVTRVVGPGDFFLGNVRVQTTPSTVFQGGTVDEIVVGVELEVEGSVRNGVLIATEVEFEDSVKLEGNIAAKLPGPDARFGTLTLKGLSPIVVEVNSQTEFKGQGDPSDLTAFAVDDHVRVRGRKGTPCTPSECRVVATELEKRDPDADVILQGPIDSANDPILVILQVTVDTSDPQFQFEDVNDNHLSRLQFFNAIKVGTLVKAEGVLSDNTIRWEEAELED